MKKWSGVAAVVAAGLLWGTVGYFRRMLDTFGFSAMQIVAVRTLTAFCVLALYALIRNRKAFRIRIKDAWLFFGTGIVSVLLFNWCYFTCMSYASLPVAAVLMYTSPVFAALLSALLFRESITALKVVAMCIAVGGSVLATGVWESGAAITPAVLALGLSSGLLYALYSVFSHIAIKRYGYGALTINLYTFLFAAVGAWLLADPVHLAGKLFNLSTLPYVLGVGVLTAALPYLLFTYGLTQMEVGRANILVMVELCSVTLVSRFLFHEQLRWYSYVGILLVLAAIAVLSLSRKEHSHAKAT